MPLDPSIPLQGQVPQINPLQMALQVAQFRLANANGNALQQQIASNQATSRAYQSSVDPETGKLDTNKLSVALSQDPDAAYNYAATMKGVTDQQQAQTSLDTARLDQAQKAQSTLRQGMGSLLVKPDLSVNDVANFVGTMVQSGSIPMQVAQAEMQSIPQDPAQLRPWLAQHFNSALSGEQQLANMKPQFANVNTGQSQIAVNQNPNAIGPDGKPMPVGTVGYSVQNGLSPEAATAPTQVGITPQGAPIMGTRQQFINLSNNNNGVITALPPGEGEANATAAKGSADALVADRNIAAGTADRVYQLRSALQGLQAAPTGPGTQQTNQIKSFLLAQTLGDLGKYLPGVNPDQIKSYDEANKYLTQYASAKAASLGGGTDAKLATTLSGNASTHISNLAAQDVVKANIGLERMQQAKVDAFQQTGLPPSQYSTWAAKFGGSIDPRVFIADQMPIAKVQAMVKKMTPAQQQAFKQQYNWAVTSGYIDPPGAH